MFKGHSFPKSNLQITSSYMGIPLIHLAPLPAIINFTLFFNSFRSLAAIFLTAKNILEWPYCIQTIAPSDHSLSGRVIYFLWLSVTLDKEINWCTDQSILQKNIPVRIAAPR